VGEATTVRRAERQHGVVSYEQVRRDGVTRDAVHRRVVAGRWDAEHHGVYRIAGSVRSWEQRQMAACLAAGGRASHRAAARLWGLDGQAHADVEVLVLRTRGHEVPFRVHRTERWDPVDGARRAGIPTTSPARTLIDLAAVVRADDLELALDAALRDGLVRVPRILWRLESLGGRGRAGCATLRELLEERQGVTGRSESALETKALRLIRRARLPEPEVQHRVRDGRRLVARLDLAYPGARLAVPLDGWRHHGTRSRWQRDLASRARLAAMGWRVVALTWSDVVHRPTEVVDLLRRALAA
jgi:very-short-patch-repair endonuclease